MLWWFWFFFMSENSSQAIQCSWALLIDAVPKQIARFSSGSLKAKEKHWKIKQNWVSPVVNEKLTSCSSVSQQLHLAAFLPPRRTWVTSQPPTHPLLLSLMQYGYTETALETSSRQIFPIVSYNLPHESVPKVHPGTSALCLISDRVFLKAVRPQFWGCKGIGIPLNLRRSCSIGNCPLIWKGLCNTACWCKRNKKNKTQIESIGCRIEMITSNHVLLEKCFSP